MGLIISFAYLLLNIAGILFVAFVLVWLFKWFTNKEIDPDVYKWGKAIVALLIIIAILLWFAGVIGNFQLLPMWRPRPL